VQKQAITQEWVSHNLWRYPWIRSTTLTRASLILKTREIHGVDFMKCRRLFGEQVTLRDTARL
jgi:hypothetical protein